MDRLLKAPPVHIAERESTSVFACADEIVERAAFSSVSHLTRELEK